MGLCLSHCGEAQHKAAVVAVSISHHSASPARPSRDDPNSTHASLKRFLHLYNADGSADTRTPRASLDDSFGGIPHSSELFSLPTDSDRSSSPSPRSGRFSTDKLPRIRGSNASSRKSTPARKSCSSLPGRRQQQQQCQQDFVSPHNLRVVETTIARLEKFCDVKLFLEKRSSNSQVVCSSKNPPTDAATSLLLHASCRDLAQKLLCFANEHAAGCDEVSSMKKSLVSAASDGVHVKETDVPLENSVANFLTEVENFVSKVDAAPEVNATPGGAPSVSRLPSLRFQDADENLQFTDFEATFELALSPDRSLEDDQPSRASTLAENSVPLGLCKPALRRSRTSSDLGGVCNHVTNPKGSLQKGAKNPMLRSALTDICSNATSAHEAVARKNQPLKALTVKRGGSRSLDLQNCSLSQLEFDAVLKSERWQSMQGAAETVRKEEPQRIEGKESQRIEDAESPRIEIEESERIEDAESPRIESEESERIEDAESPRIEAQDSQRVEGADSATIQQLASEAECNTPSPSAEAATSQPTKGRVSVDGEEERIQESVCTEDANGGDETANIPLNTDIPEKSLAMAFDNLLKLLQSPPDELAQNTSQLLELLGAKTDTAAANAELSADGTHLPDVDQTLNPKPLPTCDAESWHDAPASLTITEQPELPALHCTTAESECLPKGLPEGLSEGLPEAVLINSTSNTAKYSNMES